MDRPLISLLWLARDRSRLNPWLDGLADAGLVLSLTVLATGCANVPILLGLWLAQRSLMSVGGAFYGYGWEPQLAELTFHAMFLVPILSMDPFLGPGGGGAATGAYPVPMLVILAIRFYLFKIMLGAGLIKLKSSDAKWKLGNMSAMDYFYETQVSIIHRRRIFRLWRRSIRSTTRAFLPLFDDCLTSPSIAVHLRPTSTARAESILAILSLQPETVAQIRGVEQSLRGARCPVPPLAPVTLLETDGWCNSNHVSVNPNSEWKPEVNSPRLCSHLYFAFDFAHQSLSSIYAAS
jgi:hypothetical protein